MAWFVFAVIFGVIALILLIIGRRTITGDMGGTYNVPFHYVGLGFGAVAVLFLVLSSLRTVGAGEVGVPVTFGKAGSPLASGIHFVAPWTSVKTLSIQDQNYTMSHTTSEGNQQGNDTVPVNTRDNAHVEVDSTVIYRVSPKSAQHLYVNLGADYVNKIVRPTIRTSIRDSAVAFDAVDITTSQRANYERDVQDRIQAGLARYNVLVRDVKIRDMVLPQEIQNAVNAKVAAFQESQKQAFVLQTTKQQADQRVAEANGLAEAQRIIQATLTPAYLQHEYISTLQKLVGSPNATFLFLPNGPAGVPQLVLPTK